MYVKPDSNFQRRQSTVQVFNTDTFGTGLHCERCHRLKVARYSFSGPIPPKFEHKLRRHKQSFEKIATTVVLDKDEN